MLSWSSWNHHHSASSLTCHRPHVLSNLGSRVGREPLCLYWYLLFDLSSAWRGFSYPTRLSPFGPKSGQMLNERYNVRSQQWLRNWLPTLGNRPKFVL